ncbi:MAG: NADP-dependent malic enzyme [Bacteroidota bacterium]
MANLKLSLDDLDKVFPEEFSEDQIANAQTLFLKELSYDMHKFYGGKMATVPRAGLYGFNWFNVWYTPGVSKVSTSIRDDNNASFDLSNRGNSVAIVSDSTRVLGDGNCSPSGGLGVMEGKAFLMKYLGGIDATALCIDSRNEKGENDPDKVIEFVKMLQHSFGAINLEDISQPNCFKILDTLREETSIPVWHDDAQGTGCVTLAALINALKIVDKDIGKVKLAFYGAGASNTTIARLIIKAGADPENIILVDSKGGLHTGRDDIKADTRFYRKWELCETTNPKRVTNIADAMKGADALIALSKPGPYEIKPEWIRGMTDKSIVFVCANPVPEIYPHVAKEAGAYIVATGRGDFANQVNNSLGFPGILKGALIVRATHITDNMAITAAYSIAKTAEDRGISPHNITPLMSERVVYPAEARDVAMQAIKDGVARKIMSADEVYARAEKEIEESGNLFNNLMENGFIKEPPLSMLENVLNRVIEQIRVEEEVKV